MKGVRANHHDVKACDEGGNEADGEGNVVSVEDGNEEESVGVSHQLHTPRPHPRPQVPHTVLRVLEERWGKDTLVYVI